MAERSFANEVKLLRSGAGTPLHVEGILAVTKALLESGVSYVGGYQGAPISHLMDVLGDAHEILEELDVYFENSASEATAAAMLAASVHYPLRGAVTFKSTVGLNVASDALSNLASGGVKGGALVILGEDYGEGSSIMQERSHAFAMKSQMWLLDPRPNISAIVSSVKHGFALSEASNTPVMLQLRLRSCHLQGSFVAEDNQRPPMTITEAVENPKRDTSRVVLPPASFLHEHEKVSSRWPAAVEYIRTNGLNEFFDGDVSDIGIIVQGGLYNTLNRGLELLGCSDAFGNTRVPMYVMNVTYPVIDEEVIEFCAGKRAVLLLEEGQPDYIEQNLNSILRKADSKTALHGKDLLPMGGEYTTQVVTTGLSPFLERYSPELMAIRPSLLLAADHPGSPFAPRVDAEQVQARPPGLCTGCPERPIFAAMKLAEKEVGQDHHVSADIGCHLFAINEPFNLGATTMGYGLGSAGASALNPKDADRSTVAVMGDGGFWHNGLTSGVGNAVFNKNDQLLVIVDNDYAAATGGQDVLSSRSKSKIRSTQHPIERAVRGVGVKWAETMSNTYDVGKLRDLFVKAFTSEEEGPKVIIAESECQLNAQRREKPKTQKKISEGKRVVRQRFGVDADTCTGDHACIRISGCPSLTLKDNPDPMRTDPVATVIDSCVGCGVCGANAHAASLCPSFYRTDVVINPNWGDRFLGSIRAAWISLLSAPIERRASKYEVAA
ncbi:MULTISPECIES: indolepyruvate ferredoxin oxidoreductase subunit alpha [unclassified Leucobacter]|uniref:thiamine pyrophosphate-dependent enzyme n=1 Tax=unclassified Leucobacter TaxID=2621730 RepID=UPI00165DDA7F|nr:MULTISPECIES: indolepyruvate ferredoxin oxidoreductase subunit alpha [unclassified Leucobacter]MBC9937100.1 indolepyruvate ferredoxin oxidoreductase subunit alpha [Leucobacter sp. cx-87]